MTWTSGARVLTGFLVMICSAGDLVRAQGSEAPLRLNERGYFERRGLNVLVFNNWYDDNFSDAKLSGVEFIHHGVRTATNGDVRLNPTPEQWDPCPTLLDRRVSRDSNSIQVTLSYPAFGFVYVVEARAENGSAHPGRLIVSVTLPRALPPRLEGRAGFELEFLPSVYVEKMYVMDETPGLFPLRPVGPMVVTPSGSVESQPIATGRRIVLAPEDPFHRIAIESRTAGLGLLDGRNKAQNGWFVVRSQIPSGATGKVIEWSVDANTVPGWIRPPVIAHSQVGYHPAQEKVAVLEFDRNDTPDSLAAVFQVREDGESVERFRGKLQRWGDYLRYHYETFDFSMVREPGIYVIRYGSQRTKPFRIARDVYETAWQPTLDVFFPVQMDHMYVKEAYRVWHGAAHRDDALQAPVNHEHFDLYAQGPTTDSPFRPGEHIPGLNVGGWFDAGDFDIRTQTQYAVVLNLVQIWESYHIMRDETTIDQDRKQVLLHVPDGKPDLLQQIEHGTLGLIAQHRAVGHAISGIIDADLSRYTHIGDASTQTDNVVYDQASGTQASEDVGMKWGDDRWAFTSKSTPLNYGSAAALAAASRALRGYNDQLAGECLATARKVWDDEHAHAPDVFQHGNTTGGPLEVEELKAAVELLVCTRDARYAKRIRDMLPEIEQRFALTASFAARAIPFMDASYARKLEPMVRRYRFSLDSLSKANPFGVPISTTSWGGAGIVVNFALTNYALHKAFPGIIGAEHVFSGLHYIFGCHPGSDISFVSGVGTESKKIAYGNNRADFTFIPGGLVPGIVIVKPDLPENKEDWPFLWGENEYVVNAASSYLLLVQAIGELLGHK